MSTATTPCSGPAGHSTPRHPARPWAGCADSYHPCGRHAATAPETDRPTPPPSSDKPAVASTFKPLPWPTPPAPIKHIKRVIKVYPDRTDVKDVGAMLDLFV